MKKARAWLEANGVEYRLHDYKTMGLTAPMLQGWVALAGWEALLNRAGTTFRKLPEADRTMVDEARAIQLMLGQPSMVKRPVLEVDGIVLVGFQPQHYAARFGR